MPGACGGVSLGPVAPLGGTLLMAGWGCWRLGAAALAPPRAMIAAAYLAAEGFEAELAEELRRAGRTRLGLAWPAGAVARAAGAGWPGRSRPGPRRVELPAPSVKAAADALRGIQRNWAPMPPRTTAAPR